MRPLVLLGCSLLVGCSPSGPDAPRSAPSPSSETTSSTAPTSDAPKAGARVCAPVAACNMFVSCALAEEIPGSTPARMRVLAYEHHPNRVGETWPISETCWEKGGQRTCAQALQYETAVCTPVPPAQLELDYACRMEGARCIQVERAAAAPASSDATPSPDVIDFEDQLAGDASGPDASTVSAKPNFVRYKNGRFGFSLDVPAPFAADAPPANGDGQRWRIPRLVAVAASGMQAIPEMGPSCANSKHVLAHAENATSCWATGKRDGFIFWERYVVAGGTAYSLRFQYVEALKEKMDPIVTRMNKSWAF